MTPDGTRVAVGAPMWGSGNGKAYVFDGSDGSQLLKVTSGRDNGDTFGETVAMNSDGTLIFVGARLDDQPEDDPVTDSGCGYVFDGPDPATPPTTTAPTPAPTPSPASSPTTFATGD